jgi:hypothetical protein
MVSQLGAASQVALPCNAYCVCTLVARYAPLVQNPLRGFIAASAVSQFS